jgi:hypothetical protein
VSVCKGANEKKADGVLVLYVPPDALTSLSNRICLNLKACLLGAILTCRSLRLKLRSEIIVNPRFSSGVGEMKLAPIT